MMKENKFFIQEQADAVFLHGGIGVVDIEKILISEGFKPIRFPRHFDFSFIAKIVRLFYLLWMLVTLPSKSIIVFISPLHARMNRLLIRLVRKRMRIICFIADIDGLKDGNDALLEKELKEFRKFNEFILHNEKMKEWLVTNAGNKKIAMIEFFDFLATPSTAERSRSDEIVFAGNLAKSGFVNHLEKLPLRFNIYGEPVSRHLIEQNNVDYKGVFDPYEMPSKVIGSFGLVWDGESIAGMEGSIGFYMQYISHHKLSLYILSGLPIIIYAKAGARYLVDKYKIGFSVNSISEIKPIIDSISQADYDQMCFNMQLLARKISGGECLKQALKELEI